MAVDPQLLEILVCPIDHAKLNVVELSQPVRERLVARYREQFKDEEPIVEVGLACSECGRVYPVVSDIPVMLTDEAVAAEEVQP